MGKRKGKRRWRPLSAHEQEMLMRREQHEAEGRRRYLDLERRLRWQQAKRFFMWKLVGVAVGGVLAGVMHALGRI